MIGRWALAGVLFSCLALDGCATLPRNVEKFPSHALHDPLSTRLGRLVARSAAGHGPGVSGLRLLASGEEAFDSLIALADNAQRTLDLQYYIIDDDESSRVILEHVRMAAERGVRVRILVDDFNTAGQDNRFMRLGELPNIEVRIFNPFPGGRFSMWSRLLFSAAHIARINHRMHDKLFVADNCIAITGGRNIGDEYFTRNRKYNFVDLDVIAAGPIVSQLSASFDRFWNSKYSYPISSIDASVPTEPEPRLNTAGTGPEGGKFLAREIKAGHLRLDWVPATVLADRPVKIASETSPAEEKTIANNVAALIRSAKKDVLIISPYFVPGKRGVALMRSLVARGVRIHILTNSLATTDAPIVNIGYARYRKPLLRLGVDLRELRPKIGEARPRFRRFGHSSASLHAKAIVIDDHTVFIGSMNMDARSAHTNTELGIVFQSTQIAGEVTALFDDIARYGCYKLKFIAGTHKIEWIGKGPGAERIWYHDPQTTLLERIALRLLTPFAPEQLM
ncbi:MAG TPA: phospholipase D family protein [Steroidobacteraceae bacterium]|nr:phospholipase D family protein [Steroidobacteraceae bacterium]